LASLALEWQQCKSEIIDIVISLDIKSFWLIVQCI